MDILFLHSKEEYNMKLRINRRLGFIDFDISVGEMVLVLFILKLLIDYL